ncbi:hypothetical protein A8B78_14390 [Jannaschia sp. EhC01]|nr:hypothetical protein A8B78_14390 [Jannaschia sp. EhC01]
MKNRTLLFLMTEDTADAEVHQMAEYAVSENAHLVCFMLSRMPTQPMNAHGAFPYGGYEISDHWVEEVNSARDRLKARQDALEALLQAEGVSAEVQVALSSQPDVRVVVARRVLVCDVAIASKSLRVAEDGLFRPALYGVLFDAPVGLMLNATPIATPKRIFVAWDTELPAARAIHAALPLLKQADEVIVGSFDPVAQEYEDGENPGSDLAKWLSHHGCQVTVNQYPSGGEIIGAAIQRRAAEIGADLVVMGAYGKSRLRELVFGGTTHHMIIQTETPVFMAH